MSRFDRLAAGGRGKKLRWFQKTTRPRASYRILEVGGETNGTRARLFPGSRVIRPHVTFPPGTLTMATDDLSPATPEGRAPQRGKPAVQGV